MLICTGCGREHGTLESFPGTLCLECWAESAEGRRMPTADEVVALWGKVVA